MPCGPPGAGQPGRQLGGGPTNPPAGRAGFIQMNRLNPANLMGDPTYPWVRPAGPAGLGRGLDDTNKSEQWGEGGPAYPGPRPTGDSIPGCAKQTLEENGPSFQIHCCNRGNVKLPGPYLAFGVFAGPFGPSNVPLSTPKLIANPKEPGAEWSLGVGSGGTPRCHKEDASGIVFVRSNGVSVPKSAPSGC
eukprot:gene9853-biopygen15278